MTRRSLVLVWLILGAACKAPQKPVAPAAGGVAQVRATVITIRTTIQPGDKTHTHMLVIAGDKARSTNELDAWRLFDTKANTVTFVDDPAKSVRTEALDALLRKRNASLATALPAHYPRARVTPAKTSRAILGMNAQQTLIESGAYRRELWFAELNAIPGSLFAMMQASDPPSSPLAPMMRDVDQTLTRARGFPLADRAEMPYGKTKMVVERNVIGIAQRDVPRALFEVPRGYRDLSAPTRPSPQRPTTSSRTSTARP